jgi:hypothetical protein
MISVRLSARLLICACIGALLGFSQNYRAQVRGLVTDQSQGVLPGATVTLTNVNTGVNIVKQTDSAGIYLFDFVDPGAYRVKVDASGFGPFTQENVMVQSGGDVTVNASLHPGALQQSITVSEAPPAIEFNNSNQELTIDTKMANDTPRVDRNAFKLTLLEPAAVNTRGEMLPFNSWAANSVDLGGGTNLKNNLLVDGSPIGMGHKVGYVPNQDDVQESIVSRNSVEADSGHSAGGLISVTTKAGTNDWHGMAFYLGRYPWLSAEADRTTFSANAQRQNMYGGTFSNPLKTGKFRTRPAMWSRCRRRWRDRATFPNRTIRMALFEPYTILSRQLSRRMELLRARHSLVTRFRPIDSIRWRRISWLPFGTPITLATISAA